MEAELASSFRAPAIRTDSSSDLATMVAVTKIDAACTVRDNLSADTSMTFARLALNLSRSNDCTVPSTMYVCSTVRMTAKPGDSGGNGSGGGVDDEDCEDGVADGTADGVLLGAANGSASSTDGTVVVTALGYTDGAAD